MRALQERTSPPVAIDDDPLAFAVFALKHAACGDATVWRIGERCILG